MTKSTRELAIAASERSSEVNKNGLTSMRNTITARVLGGDGWEPTNKKQENLLTGKAAEPGKSKAIQEDPFAALANQGRIVESPFDMLALSSLPEQNSDLIPIISAMQANIELTGHRFVPRQKLTDEEKTAQPELAAAQKEEHLRLQNFFEYATQESFTEFRSRLRRDKESTGCDYFEVIRDAIGDVQQFNHIRSYQCRLGRQEERPRLVKRKILKLVDDNVAVVEEIEEYKRHRQMVQSRFVASHNYGAVSSPASQVRWFKEFNDPWEYSVTTGERLEGKELDETRLKNPDNIANEYITTQLYSGRTPYGMPRHIGQLLSIFGDRAAEEVTYQTLRNNNIPSMIVAVANGQVTEGTVDRINSFIESNIQSSDNFSKFLIIEAEASEDDAGEDGLSQRISITPLVSNQHTDQLYQKYAESNRGRVQRAYRIPPLYFGETASYTRTTAEVAQVLADKQVFNPAREEFDNLINRILLPEMGIVYHLYRTNTPNTTDNTQLVKLIADSEKTGGMTPRIARDLLEQVVGRDLPSFPGDFDQDLPFSLLMAEAVKNQADPTEPGQQVTALKSSEILKSLESLGVINSQGPRLTADDLERFSEAYEKLSEHWERTE